EARAIRRRAAGVTDAMRAIRSMRRRELLRIAMGALVDVLTIDEVAAGLTTVTEVTIQAALAVLRREEAPDAEDSMEFAVIAMGRFGGAELGFGSDADVMFVHDPGDGDPQRAQERALALVSKPR